MTDQTNPAKTEAIVINVDTGPVTTLAVLSLLRHTPFPVRLIDCSRSEEETAYMEKLATYLDIAFEYGPLKAHGQTLDDLFARARSERLLVMDSDAELLSDQLPMLMEQSASRSGCFGAGFLQEGSWMLKPQPIHAWYATRVWIPLCMLNTAPVRRALQAGISFAHRVEFNDLPNWPRLSKYLSLRFRLPGSNALRLGFLDPWREEYFRVKPCYVYFDTGADLHAWLTQHGYSFSEMDWPSMHGNILHHHGVTRRKLHWFDRQNAGTRKPFTYARERLREMYRNDLPEHLQP
ncbi:MAG: hypothetical protein WD397_02380 [Wenzhouxiangellaceae bacterium]